MWLRTESGRVLIMSGDERERELLSALSIISLSSSISLLCPQFASDIATSNTNARSTMKKKEATATKKRKRNNTEINNEEERSNPGGDATVRTAPNGEGSRREKSA